VREYRPGETFQIGDCHVSLHALRHALPNCGARVQGPGATRAYTGDTGVTDALHALAADAARAAQAAGAARLMLTHLPHTDATRLAARKAEAERHFDGPALLASPGLTHDLA
jgi:ribonuclease BN (tRNA processing enzyme)